MFLCPENINYLMSRPEHLSIFINAAMPLNLFKYKRLTALAVAMLGSACATALPTGVDLVCTVDKQAQINRDCSSVPSLAEGVLTLSANGRFKLEGRYEACYHIENIQFSGTYISDIHAAGIDYELLSANELKNNQRTQSLSRTIGLLNLDTRSFEARFTDTAAVIRSRGQLSTVAPSVEMNCIKQ